MEFREGDIDNMPVNDETADVVVSNCVLNLVPDKEKVIQQIYRVLKPGGHFSISDIVLTGALPPALKADAEMYAGCVAGAIHKDSYLEYIRKTGFQNITLQKEKSIFIPEDILSKYLLPAEVKVFNQGGTGIYSITVYAEKPGVTTKVQQTSFETGQAASCQEGTGCC